MIGMTKDQVRIAVGLLAGYVWYRLPPIIGNERKYRALFHPAIHEYEGQSDMWKVRADGTEGIANIHYMETKGHLPNYPESRDDVWPVILEQRQKNQFFTADFHKALAEEVIPGAKEENFYFGTIHLQMMFEADALKLCNALLKASNPV